MLVVIASASRPLYAYPAIAFTKVVVWSRDSTATALRCRLGRSTTSAGFPKTRFQRAACLSAHRKTACVYRIERADRCRSCNSRQSAWTSSADTLASAFAPNRPHVSAQQGLRNRESSSHAAAVWRKAAAIDPGTHSGSASTSPDCGPVSLAQHPAQMSLSVPQTAVVSLIQVFPLLGFGIAAVVHTHEPGTAPRRTI
jgi:hypothetical protein